MVIGFVMTPYFITHLGAESYGLVAFFSLLTAWMNLLDLGMTPTLGREVASSRVSGETMIDFRKLLRSFEMIFLGISILVFASIYLFRNWLSVEWIKSFELSRLEISKCISIMGVLIGFRFFSSLYRSVIIGFENQVWLNIINILFSTLKFIGVLFLFKFISTNVYIFFEYQFVLGIVEVFVLMVFVYIKLPSSNIKIPIFSFYWLKIKSIIPFALGIAYTSAIWIFVSQVDKLVLSGVLSLKEFGYFNLVIMLSTTISVLSGPISQSILPRMVYLFSTNEIESMLKLYRNGTQLVTLISSALAIIVALFSEQIVYAWTGNLQAATWSKDVLFWYSLGSGVLTILGFQYFLQVAYGQLKLHVIGGTLSFFIDVPIIVFISKNFGAESAGMVWFILRLLWLFLWTPLIHNRFAPGLHWKWFFNDVFKIVLCVLFLAILLKVFFPFQIVKGYRALFNIFIFGFSVLSIGSLSSSFLREKYLEYFNRIKS
jgi:O-antigen/teichoic acid export membrane protein